MIKTTYFFKIIKIVCVTMLIIFTATVLFIQHNIYLEEKYEEKTILQQIEKEKSKQEKLQEELQYSLSDKYIEKVARETFGFVKDGETVFINDNK